MTAPTTRRTLIRHSALLATLLTLAACSGGNDSTAAKVDITVTSQVGSDMKPVDDLDTVSKSAGRFTVYMHWHDIPTRRKGMVLTEADPITYTLDIYDGQGKRVSHDIHTLEPSSDEALSFGLHDFKPAEAPGQWTIELSWPEQEAKKTLTVTP